MASDAAAETLWIVAFSALLTDTLLRPATSPPVVVTPWLALAMYASTSLSIVFSAMDRPMETETDRPPDSEADRAAAPALATMDRGVRGAEARAGGADAGTRADAAVMIRQHVRGDQVAGVDA